MNQDTKQKPEVTRYGVLDMQVCVPKTWTDTEVLDFANAENPSGTEHGWSIRQQGSKLLDGCDERVNCDERIRPHHVRCLRG